MNNKPSNRNRPVIPPDVDSADLVFACANALRVWSTNSAPFVGSAEIRDILFAEALSVAQADMSTDDIALMLRGMAAKVEEGGLGPSSIQ